MLGWALFVGSGVSSSIAAALATETFDQVPPAIGCGLRFAFAGLVLMSLRRPRLSSWPRARLRDSALLGALMLANVIVLYLALERLPLGTTITLEFLGPLAIATLHAHKWQDHLAAACAIGGVALVSGASAQGDLLGVAYALCAAVGWAIYIQLARRLGAYPRPADSLAGALGFGALLSIPLAIAACLQIDGLEVLLLLLAVGITGRLLPYACEIFALRRLTPGAAGVLFSIIPVIAAVVGVLLLDQPYSSTQVAGLFVVVVGSALVLRDAAPA